MTKVVRAEKLKTVSEKVVKSIGTPSSVKFLTNNWSLSPMSQRQSGQLVAKVFYEGALSMKYSYIGRAFHWFISKWKQLECRVTVHRIWSQAICFSDPVFKKKCLECFHGNIRWQYSKQMTSFTAESWLALCLLVANFEDPWWPLQTIWISDEAPQNVGPHLRSKLFDIRLYICKILGGKDSFLQIWKKKKWIKVTPHGKCY